MIKFDSETLTNYLKFKLDKIEDEFTFDDLSKIDELFLDYQEEAIDLRVVDNFKNLKRIELINFTVSNEDINIMERLSKLDDITFDRCNFEEENNLTKLHLSGLSLINCFIDNCDFVYEMKDLKELSLIHLNVDTNKLNTLSNLTHLQLSYSSLSNEEIDINSLEELYIDNTNINKIDFTLKLPKLKILSINEEQYLNNKDLVKDLIKNKIEVLNDGIIRFEGDTYE